MTEEIGGVPSVRSSDLDHAEKLMEKLVGAAKPGAVFGQPVTNGQYTAITASEVATGGGFGFGAGGGPAPTPSGAQSAVSGGSGAGGGGGSMGRPVAVIEIGPDGVTVKPVLDITKLAIAGITAWGAMAIALRRMKKASRR